jgi:hypothetical protein
VIPGGRRDGDGRETVDIVRHDTGAVASVVWTLRQLLAAIARSQPRSRAARGWTFAVGRRHRRLVIVTDGPARFSARHPLWTDTGRPAGAMTFAPLSLADVRRVLEQFYAGTAPDRCFAGLAGEFSPQAQFTVTRAR